MTEPEPSGFANSGAVIVRFARRWAAEPVWDDPGDISVAEEPCQMCGEATACAYDGQGRPLVHVFGAS